ncbi:glycoside hydrolase family 28 protein [Streptomyces clavuligerus]|uniref:Pectate lyase n=2 Tax=Streptomyces clavuligerus TaxID=1901 RepID=E2PY67_STRCL|nr:glycoside hydrolase family 28 protein [Streptomyces clavuligerus]ANW17284.1 glycoside hydrolase [Streptomyces clavuligerus]AXU11830.1 glycoside hydrolase family 28 protein [Streptomyces clavuligerus]EFG10243.1 Pectate lyase [Streptomyces clavuligerus]MBY6301668.1 glycoside hydrolase family 28 protein [Streptomyces clavuligerus]QCS04608.1 glycoside hydrolase [Streptomyces clavuligerus]
MSPISRRTALGVAGTVTAAGLLPPALAAGAAHADTTVAGLAQDPWERVPAILARIRPPTFPNRRFDITRYGAVGDGVTKNTRAFRDAIRACHRAGGGRVVVPRGRFLTGAIQLRSQVELHVREGGTVLFSTDPRDYLPMVFTRWEGTECWNYSSFIYARGQQDLAITGRGTLDGQGMAGPWKSWRDPGGNALVDQAELRRMGTEGVPVDQRLFGDGHHLRPNMIQFYDCRNILMQDITVLEPPMWTIHPVLCRNVTLRNVDVIGRINNSDGVDPECTSDMLITGCRFHTEDDSIAVKSGRDEDGHRIGVPSRNIVIRDCVFSGRWGGVAVGSEMSGGVRDVFAEDCRINPVDFPGRYNPRHPVFIKTNKKRGGSITGVYIRRFTGRAIDRDCVYLTTRYAGQQGERPAVIRDIRIEDMVHDGARRAIHLEGLDSDPFTGVHIARCRFTGMAQANVIGFARDLTIRDVLVNGTEVVYP